MTKLKTATGSDAETATDPGQGVARPWRCTWLALALVAIVGVTYANALPNTLVFDDKLFFDYQRFADPAAVPAYFVDHVWASRTTDSGLYRPLLFVTVSLDATLFGDWFTGYHLSNILLHAMVTAFLFLLVTQLLSRDERTRAHAVAAAFLAAAVFAIHPAHTEVVNSVFNRSVTLAALACVFGLWWLLKYLESRPVLAWSGLLLAYICGLFSRETAIVLPGLACLLVLVYSPGSVRSRMRSSLPVFFMLLPMLLYLLLREQVLSSAMDHSGSASIETSGVLAQIHPGRLLDPKSVLDAAGTLVQGFKVLLWPVAQRLFYPNPSPAWQWASVFLHVGLLALAVFQLRRGHRGLFAGLAVFYIAILPASRLFGSDVLDPHLQERYLYLPAVGPVIVLSYALAWLSRRFDPLMTAAPVVLVLLLTIPTVWARNALWADEVALFEAEYSLGTRSGYLLTLLTGAQLHAGNFGRVLEICDANRDRLEALGRFSTHCGSALSYAGRLEEAEIAYLNGTRIAPSKVLAHSNLAQHFLRQGRWEDAKQQFEHAVAAERTPARVAFRTGYMLVHLYPNRRDRLLEARERFKAAADLEPKWRDPRQWLDRLNAALGPEVQDESEK